MSTSTVLCSDVRQIALSSRVNVELDTTSSLKCRNVILISLQALFNVHSGVVQLCKPQLENVKPEHD